MSILLCIWLNIFSVNDTLAATAQLMEPLLEQQLEQSFDEDAETVDVYDMMEELEYFTRHPINVNAADIKQLRKIFFLTDQQLINLKRYISDYGAIVGLHELQYIYGFDDKVMMKMKPFVCFGPLPGKKFTGENIRKYSKQQLLLKTQRNIESAKGFTDTSSSRYLGNLWGMSMKYQYTWLDKIKIGFAAAQDRGEPSFNKYQPQGFDFYSGYVKISNIKWLETLIVGNYQLQFGQGLTLWNGLSFGKSCDGMGVKKNAANCKSYASTMESGVLQGIATTVNIDNYSVSTFFSYRHLDGNIENTDDAGKPTSITSIYEIGYHRTEKEMQKKDIVVQTVYGGHIDYNGSFYKIGFTGYHHALSLPLHPQKKMYAQFNEALQAGTNAGVDYDFIFRKINLFGEMAMDNYFKPAFIQSIALAPVERISMILSYRNYSKSYRNLFTSALAESSGTSNEQGLLLNINMQLHKRWTLNFMSDMFHFPWLAYGVDAPSFGNEQQVLLTYQCTSSATLQFKYSNKEKAENEVSETGLNHIIDRQKHHFRCHFDYKVSEEITLKNRLEYTFSSKGDNGLLLYQDCSYHPLHQPYSFGLRYAAFATDSYASRIYAVEPDVLYAFSSTAYYYKGCRFVILFKYEPVSSLALWLRYAATYYADRQTIGSGAEEIGGNIKSEIKIQLSYKF